MLVAPLEDAIMRQGAIAFTIPVNALLVVAAVNATGARFMATSGTLSHHAFLTFTKLFSSFVSESHGGHSFTGLAPGRVKAF